MTGAEVVGYLRRFMETWLPRPPKGYRAYSTAYDEIICASDLVRSLNDPEAAYNAFDRFCQSMVLERSSLATQALRIARKEPVTEDGAVAISLLIDHSGSMKGANLQLAAMIAEGFESLARASACQFEILGFTTVDWHGAPVRKQWIAGRRPFSPGRLCALRHIVYRAFGYNGPTPLHAMFAPRAGSSQDEAYPAFVM